LHINQLIYLGACHPVSDLPSDRESNSFLKCVQSFSVVSSNDGMLLIPYVCKCREENIFWHLYYMSFSEKNQQKYWNLKSFLSYGLEVKVKNSFKGFWVQSRKNDTLADQM